MFFAPLHTGHSVWKQILNKQTTMATILLIDDDPWVLNIFTQMLVREGHTVVPAENGQQGIDLYRESPADLVITDMVMPFKDGLETIMELKHEFPNVKIIAISGGGAIEPGRYLSLAKNIGAVATMTKPLTKEDLVCAVNKVLAKDNL